VGTGATFKVTCVISDTPTNSTLQFDILICAGVGPPTEYYWSDPSYATYFLLGDGASPTSLAEKMTKDIGRNQVVTSAGKKIDFSLKRLSDKSLSSNDKMLAMIGVFILIISWINFINLSIGNAHSRSKETGVRKVIGATRNQMISEFVLECILINGIALLLSMLIFSMAKPLLMDFSNNKVLPLFGDPTSINLYFTFAFILGALISSAYPAFIVSSSNPINSLKGKSQGRYGLAFRKVLVIAQFAASVVAAVGVFIVSDQLDFFLKQDLKIKLDQIIAIKAPKDLWEGKTERLASFKNDAMDLTMVENVATSTTTPGQDYRHEVNFHLANGPDRRWIGEEHRLVVRYFEIPY
jgi:putative ABC transport system permease protein